MLLWLSIIVWECCLHQILSFLSVFLQFDAPVVLLVQVSVFVGYNINDFTYLTTSEDNNHIKLFVDQDKLKNSSFYVSFFRFFNIHFLLL